MHSVFQTKNNIVFPDFLFILCVILRIVLSNSKVYFINSMLLIYGLIPFRTKKQYFRILIFLYFSRTRLYLLVNVVCELEKSVIADIWTQYIDVNNTQVIESVHISLNIFSLLHLIFHREELKTENIIMCLSIASSHFVTFYLISLEFLCTHPY